MNYKTIYIICPANGRSGGSEALHQLAHVLTKKKQSNLLVYVDYKTLEFVSAKTPTKFKWYHFKISNLINDDENNLVIIPETMTNYLYKIKSARKAIWWLSVDYGVWKENFKNDTILHFCQSHYALNFLLSKGVTISYMLSDFVVTYRLISLLIRKKKNIIVYDPRKVNSEFNEVKKIIELNYTFKTIENLDRIRLSILLAQSDIYFDLGGNPGKDRLPREAILHHTIPIISNLGSAVNTIDFQFSTSFKLSLETPPENICKQIIAINKQVYDTFKEYINFHTNVVNEKRIFNAEVNQIFGLNGNFKMNIFDQIRVFICDLKELNDSVFKPALIKIYKGLK